MAAEKRAEVTWRGSLADGEGTIEGVGSETFGPLAVSWAKRTGEDEGTSPEELIAAAHAACFSMAFSKRLADSGATPENLAVSAKVTFVPGTGITTSALEVVGTVPGIDEAAFRGLAEDAKENCPVSQALTGNVAMTVDARLTG